MQLIALQSQDLFQVPPIYYIKDYHKLRSKVDCVEPVYVKLRTSLVLKVAPLFFLLFLLATSYLISFLFFL